MEITLEQSRKLKGVAIMLMVVDHLFNNHEYLRGLYDARFFIGKYPLSFYFGLFGSLCVPIYLFVSGYGLFQSYKNRADSYMGKIPRRIGKLYVIYWISLIIFPLLIGLLIGKPGYPGSLWKFLMAATGIIQPYNGTLWFFTIYIFLVLISRWIFLAVSRYDIWMVLLGAGVLYIAGFYFRVYTDIHTDNQIVEWLVYNFSKLATSIFCFVLGALSNKYKWYSWFYAFCEKYKINNLHLAVGITLLFVLKGVLTSVIFAAFIAIPFIFFFNKFRFGNFIEIQLHNLIHHSTNIWLTHFYLCSIFFKDFFYSFRYPLLIFVVLFALNLLISILMNYVRNPLLKILKLS